MKKLLLFASFLAIPFSGNSQIFQENFDGSGPGFASWTTIDVDGLTPNAAVAFITTGWNRIEKLGANGNFGGPAGDFAAMSTSYYTPPGISNDWLISPQINLPAASAFIQWDAKAQDADFPDGYKVMLSPNGGNTVADFTVELFTTAGESPTYITRSASLAAYANTTVRVAFVNNSNDKFVLLIDNILVNLTPTTAPLCPTLVAPANNATAVNYTAPVALSWTAATTGSAATSYDVFLGTTPNPTTLLTATSTTTASAPGLLPSTVYYWRVIAKNAAGDSVGCTDFMFTTAANPFAPYCGPLLMTSAVEPITLVNFAGINNATTNTVNQTPAHEDFIATVGNVMQGGSYPITLKGNTDGPFTNRFAVFIDWNQNGILSDAGEVYAITQTIVNSTGLDAIQATQILAVPTDALLGTTRMRVKKIFGTTNYLDPCLGSGFGQVEEYSINVGALGVDNNVRNSVKVYPNPVIDVVNIDAASKVSNVQVFDLSGKIVSSHQLNAVKNQINLSKLTPGIYIVNIKTESGVQSMKIMKK